MTASEAKKIIKTALEARKLPFSKLTARTISFIDLARASCLFVKIHGWQPSPQWTDLQQVAKQHGFCVEA
jgi:hypothetical protein